MAWALGELRDRFGANLPACLVGHSLGGRAALLAAGRNDVRSVVALNPWLYGSEGDLDLSGRQVLFVHGDEDRVASPARLASVAAGLRRTAEVGYVRVSGGKHAMLRHGRTFDRVAADFAAATLLGDDVRDPVRRVLGGEPLVEVCPTLPAPGSGNDEAPAPMECRGFVVRDWVRTPVDGCRRWGRSSGSGRRR